MAPQTYKVPIQVPSSVQLGSIYNAPLPEHYMHSSQMGNFPYEGNSAMQPVPKPGTNPVVRMAPSPPLGARTSTSYMPRYSRYPNSLYMPHNRFPVGMYGGYSSFGGYGMPFSPYGNNSYNSFAQMAEESSRPAFEAIESLVNVVGSVSMMLESTYQAVHSSYSAILGMVDQFSRLKDHLASFLSILALFRFLRWMCLKILYWLRLRKENPSSENIWNQVEKISGSNNAEFLKETHRSALPFLLFMGLVIGAPWLMFKLLARAVPKKQNSFKDYRGKYYTTVAAYDFTARNTNEISFKAGEKLYIHPQSIQNNTTGWVYACNTKKEKGHIPINHLQTMNNARVASEIRQSPLPNTVQESASATPFEESINQNSQPSDEKTNEAQSAHHDEVATENEKVCDILPDKNDCA